MKKKLFIFLTIAIIFRNMAIITCNILPDTLSLSFYGYRNPVQLVSWVNGYVLNDTGDGRVTSLGVDDYYNYIYYDPDTFKQGDKVFTLSFYNPFTLYGDDLYRILDIKTGER